MSRKARWVAAIFALLIVGAVVVPVVGPGLVETAGPVRCDQESGAALVHRLGPRERVRYYARRHLGIPYRWGGTTHAGLDCSGFVQHVFAHAGFCLPRTSYFQAFMHGASTPASWSRMRRGDLVYWRTGHIAIYAGWWDRHYHIWETSRPGRVSERRVLAFGRSSWDRQAVARHLNFAHVHRC